MYIYILVENKQLLFDDTFKPAILLFIIVHIYVLK